MAVVKRYVPSDGEPKSLRGAWISDEVEVSTLEDDPGEDVDVSTFEEDPEDV